MYCALLMYSVYYDIPILCVVKCIILLFYWFFLYDAGIELKAIKVHNIAEINVTIVIRMFFPTTMYHNTANECKI